MRRNKKGSSKVLIESLDSDYEDMEDCEPAEEIDLKNFSVISSFSFGREPISLEMSADKQLSSSAVMNAAACNQRPGFSKQAGINTQSTQAYGATPPIDGECFELKRTFVFRRSTLRLLNKIKAEHPDENVYLSTIVDAALRHYYECVFK